MKEKQRITAFYMELLLLAVVFVAVILSLTQVFALAKERSSRAQVLTRSVVLAENAAEVLANAGEEDLVELLGDGESATWVEEGRVLRAAYDEKMQPLSEGEFQVVLEILPDDGLNTCVISVYWRGGEAPVYTLETVVYREET